MKILHEGAKLIEKGCKYVFFIKYLSSTYLFGDEFELDPLASPGDRLAAWSWPSTDLGGEDLICNDVSVNWKKNVNKNFSFRIFLRVANLFFIKNYVVIFLSFLTGLLDRPQISMFLVRGKDLFCNDISVKLWIIFFIFIETSKLIQNDLRNFKLIHNMWERKSTDLGGEDLFSNNVHICEIMN